MCVNEGKKNPILVKFVGGGRGREGREEEGGKRKTWWAGQRTLGGQETDRPVNEAVGSECYYGDWAAASLLKVNGIPHHHDTGGKQVTIWEKEGR